MLAMLGHKRLFENAAAVLHAIHLLNMRMEKAAGATGGCGGLPDGRGRLGLP